MSLRLQPREAPSAPLQVAVYLAALLLAGLLGAALFALAGAPPLAALWALLTEPFGSAYGLSETLLRTVPLGFAALAVALALKIDLWNIGAEGQLYVGALAATAAGLLLPGLLGGDPPLAALWALLAGFLAGGLWALGPGLLRAYLGVSEIISTLMLNYVAIAWVELMVYGPWKGADGFPYTEFLSEPWRLPLLWRRVHLGLPVLLGLALLLWLLERQSLLGYQVRVTGASLPAARYAGIPVLSRLLLLMGAAGGMAGLGGAMLVCGVEYRLHAGISPGYGYTAIIVAFLARRHLLASLLVAFLFAALAVGGDGLQMSYPGVSASIVDLFQGVLLVAVLAGDVLARYRLRWGR